MSSWVYLEYGSLGLYLVLIPSPGSSLSFSIYAHSMPVSFLSQTQVDFLTCQFKTFCQSSSNVLGTLSIICDEWTKVWERRNYLSEHVVDVDVTGWPICCHDLCRFNIYQTPILSAHSFNRSTSSFNCISEQASKIMSSAYLKLVTLRPPIWKPPS